MKNALLLSSALVLLAACGGGDDRNHAEPSMEYDYAEEYAEAPAPMGLVQASDEIRAKHAAPPPETAPSDGATASTGPMLAYTHNRSIESPAKDVGKVANSHAKQCEKAGFKKCMVVNSNQSDLDGDWARASLHIKATPEWIEAFFNDLPKDLKSTNSKLTSSSTSAQDLSTQIIDTDARLKAKLTLRDRLQALLTDRPSELGDLIELERELSRVQADIDASASLLAALKQRVAMSNLHLNYTAKQTVHSESVWSPLLGAFSGFFGNFAAALGAVITAIAVIIPWLPVVGGLLWFGRWIYRRVWRKAQLEKANKQTKTTTPEADNVSDTASDTE